MQLLIFKSELWINLDKVISKKKNTNVKEKIRLYCWKCNCNHKISYSTSISELRTAQNTKFINVDNNDNDNKKQNTYTDINSILA